MKSYDRILAAVYATPWAIMPEKMHEILGFLELKAAGRGPSDETIAAFRAQSELRAARAQTVSSSAKGSVAVIPIYGTIMQRGNMMSEFSGGCSTEQLTAQFRQAVNDPNVRAIVFDVDSPGGEVSGVPELADEIYGARKTKKTVAVSNSLMGSAAYYLACSCSQLVVSPSSLTGSIGVYTAHQDWSKAMETAGVAVTFVQHGANKTEGNSYQPLSADALSNMQALVDAFGEMFDKAVARGRGVKVQDVLDRFGQGRVFTAQQAVKLGMADRVATLDNVLADYGVSRSSGARASVAAPALAAGVDARGAADPAAIKKAFHEAFSSDAAHHIARLPAAAARSADDGECPCECDSCIDGDCSGCTHEGCDCEGCTCDMAAKAAKTRAEHEHMRMELELAGA